MSKRTMCVFFGLLFVAMFGLDANVVEAAQKAEGQNAVNGADADGTTPLHWAVHRGELEAVDRLIRSGAAVDSANAYGVTPLMLACTNGNAPAIDRLLRAGANANLASPEGETPLMIASRAGSVDAVKLLVAAGANVGARESTRGQTALMWAAHQGNAKVVRTLVELGADVNARSHGPRSADPAAPPARAYQRNLTRTGRVDAFTPLLFAVRSGRLAAVEALLDSGANVNDEMEDGTSALVLAAINAHWEVGALLLDRRAAPDAAKQGWTALHQILRTRNLTTGQFPLPVPTGRVSSLDLAKKLLVHGADVNARMTKNISDGFRHRFVMTGANAFLLAAKGSDWEMMRFLLANGADVSVTNVSGTAPLMAAAGVDIVFFGEDTGTNEDGMEAVKIMLALGADVNAVNADGDTALHGAAGRGSNPMVQLLLDKGAKIVQNKRGFTPLNVADGDGTASGSVRVFWPETLALLQKYFKD